jgi:hypothetical protein
MRRTFCAAVLIAMSIAIDAPQTIKYANVMPVWMSHNRAAAPNCRNDTQRADGPRQSDIFLQRQVERPGTFMSGVLASAQIGETAR